MPKLVFMAPDGSSRAFEVESGASVMRCAVGHDVAGIAGECGGSLVCGTCHVYVDEAWIGRVGSPREEEVFMLEFADGVCSSSRFSCQIVMTDELDGLVVHVPEAQR